MERLEKIRGVAGIVPQLILEKKMKMQDWIGRKFDRLVDCKGREIAGAGRIKQIGENGQTQTYYFSGGQAYLVSARSVRQTHNRGLAYRELELAQIEQTMRKR